MQVLKDNTRVSYDWSYIVAWAGVASSLIAAILLSGAAVCLRSEREKEEQLNLQYLMPGKNLRNSFFVTLTIICLKLLVYPQKQAPYPYPQFPHQIYPQPYYHGSQYGPYNY